MNLKKTNVLFLIISITLPILYGIFFIRNFSMPLSGGGDIDEWEYIGFYLANHLSFNPFPSLILNHNQTFYPFGTTQVFSDWSLESNYWFAFFYTNFGHGAWLNFYYIFSLIMSFLGSFLILKNDFGQNKSFIVGFVVTFCNFYAINKYPHHFNHSTIHWTILSLFTDFILVKRIVLHENISLKWIFLKAFILIAALGMNLGYICGFALNSFVISLFFVITFLLFRYFNKDFQILDYLKSWFVELKSNKFYFLLLSTPSITLLYFYLPLVLQIYFEAKSFNLDSGLAPHFWSHPLRLFLPYFPNIDTINNPYTKFFKDMPEGLGSYSPGWFCLGLGIMGFIQNRRQYWEIFIPILIILIVSLLYHPNKIPTLKVFPWGAYNRVTSRFTSMLPVIFCCFFLPISFSKFKFKFKKIIILFFTLVLATELIVVYSFKLNQKPYFFERGFFHYMKNIENLKGEAVMDFPFCIVGGDGTGLKENLCPIFNKTCNVYALSRFHHKKVVGGYYSHVQEQAINGFISTGIGNWAKPDSDNWQVASRITNVFSRQQLEHFIKYFQYNDFVGINICTELISDEMLQQIIKAIGKPTQKTSFPNAGKVIFIPKPIEWYVLTNERKAKEIHFPCGCD